MNYPENLLAVARRVVWFKPPAEALEYKAEFLAHLMTYGTIEDLKTARQHFTDDDFRAVLDNPPPGIFDGRSWAYWNTVYNRLPVPKLPRRNLP